MESTSSLLSSNSLSASLQFKTVNDVAQLHDIIQNLLEDKKYLEKVIKVKDAKIEYLESKLKQYEKNNETMLTTLSKKDNTITDSSIKVGNLTNINNNIYLDSFKDKDIEDYISDIKQMKIDESFVNTKEKVVRNKSHNKLIKSDRSLIKLTKSPRKNNFKEICHQNQMQIRSISANAKSKVKEYITNSTISKKENTISNGVYVKKKIGIHSTTKIKNLSINTGNNTTTNHKKSKSMINFHSKTNRSNSKSPMSSKRKVELGNNSKIILRSNTKKNNKKSNIKEVSQSIHKSLLTKSNSSLLSLQTPKK